MTEPQESSRPDFLWWSIVFPSNQVTYAVVYKVIIKPEDSVSFIAWTYIRDRSGFLLIDSYIYTHRHICICTYTSGYRWASFRKLWKDQDTKMTFNQRHNYYYSNTFPLIFLHMNYKIHWLYFYLVLYYFELKLLHIFSLSPIIPSPSLYPFKTRPHSISRLFRDLWKSSCLSLLTTKIYRHELPDLAFHAIICSTL